MASSSFGQATGNVPRDVAPATTEATAAAAQTAPANDPVADSTPATTEDVTPTPVEVVKELGNVSERIPLEVVAHGLALGGCEAASASTLKLASIAAEYLMSELLATARREVTPGADGGTVLDVPADNWAGMLAATGASSVPVRANVVPVPSLPTS